MTVRYRQDEVETRSRATTASGAATTDGVGHGLIGIRERVNIYGRRDERGRPTRGGFVLSTRLPVDRDQR